MENARHKRRTIRTGTVGCVTGRGLRHFPRWNRRTAPRRTSARTKRRTSRRSRLSASPEIPFLTVTGRHGTFVLQGDLGESAHARPSLPNRTRLFPTLAPSRKTTVNVSPRKYPPVGPTTFGTDHFNRPSDFIACHFPFERSFHGGSSSFRNASMPALQSSVPRAKAFI